MPTYRNLSLAGLTNPTLCFASLAAGEHFSPGDLTIETRFRQSALILEDVTTALIQQLGSMPDYKTPTTSLFPWLVRTPAAYICVDGWNMVEDAQKAQQASIRCKVKYLRQVSETDLAIIKVATRFGRQDTAPYAELAANLRRLYTFLLGTTIAPILFTHGGARAAGQSSIDQEGDLVARLTECLKKDRSTITDSLNYTKYLSDEQLNGLVDKAASKKVFERFASWRRIIRLRLQEQHVAPSDIETQISHAATQMAEAFIENGSKAFTIKAKTIYNELAHPTVNSAVTAEIPGRIEDASESSKVGETEAGSEDRETPQPENNAAPAPPANNEPDSTGDGQGADDHGQVTPEGVAHSNDTGCRGLNIEQVKAQFESICRDALTKLTPLTEVPSINSILQQHRIEVAKIQQVLIKIHAQ